MKIDLKSILVTLKWPLGLLAVFAAVLGLFGVTLEQVLVICSAMVGLWALLSLVVNILKVVGVVDPGTSGKWSAGLNLAGVLFVAVLLAYDPQFDFAGLDLQLDTFARLGAYALVFITDMVGTQAMHRIQVENLGVKAFTFAGLRAG